MQLETGERSGSITVASLRRVAAALDAELVYAIIPRRSARKVISIRARELARERVLPVAKSMLLEDQALSPKQLARQINELARELERRRRDLWR